MRYFVFYGGRGVRERVTGARGYAAQPGNVLEFHDLSNAAATAERLATTRAGRETGEQEPPTQQIFLLAYGTSATVRGCCSVPLLRL